MSTTTRRPATQLYERCAECRGLGEALPDEGIQQVLPDHSPKVRPRRRKIPVLCPGCQGAGFIVSTLTRDFVRDLPSEHEAALGVMRDFVDLCNSAAPDGPSYLSDGALLSLCLRSEELLEREERVRRRARGHEPG